MHSQTFVHPIYCVYNKVMTEEELKRMGRPPIEDGYTSQMPRIRVTPRQLKAYKGAAEQKDMKLSEWVRGALDRELNNG
jgi:hypothetical protein